ETRRYRGPLKQALARGLPAAVMANDDRVIFAFDRHGADEAGRIRAAETLRLNYFISGPANEHVKLGLNNVAALGCRVPPIAKNTRTVAEQMVAFERRSGAVLKYAIEDRADLETKDAGAVAGRGLRPQIDESRAGKSGACGRAASQHR